MVPESTFKFSVRRQGFSKWIGRSPLLGIAGHCSLAVSLAPVLCCALAPVPLPVLHLPLPHF